MLSKLPDDSTYEDIQYHLYVLEKISRGMERASQEGGVSNEDARKRFGKWLEN